MLRERIEYVETKIRDSAALVLATDPTWTPSTKWKASMN